MDNDDIDLGGRPRKEIDYDQLKKLCAIQCTKEEICGFFDIDEKTLTARIHEKYGEGFSEYYKRASAIGKTSLRRKQFEIAMKGNTTMNVWLGKQWLKQTDKIEEVAEGYSEQDKDNLWDLKDPGSIE